MKTRLELRASYLLLVEQSATIVVKTQNEIKKERKEEQGEVENPKRRNKEIKGNMNFYPFYFFPFPLLSRAFSFHQKARIH